VIETEFEDAEGSEAVGSSHSDRKHVIHAQKGPNEQGNSTGIGLRSRSSLAQMRARMQRHDSEAVQAAAGGLIGVLTGESAENRLPACCATYDPLVNTGEISAFVFIDSLRRPKHWWGAVVFGWQHDRSNRQTGSGFLLFLQTAVAAATITVCLIL
jgi:hypothetical protein